MVKYSEKIENRVLDLFKENTIVTTNMLAGIGITPSIIINNLMNKGFIARFADPLYNKRYLYFLNSNRVKVEQEVENRKKQSLHKKHRQIQNKIQEIERAKSYHLELIRKYDEGLTNLREKKRFLNLLISP